MGADFSFFYGCKSLPLSLPFSPSPPLSCSFRIRETATEIHLGVLGSAGVLIKDAFVFQS